MGFGQEVKDEFLVHLLAGKSSKTIHRDHLPQVTIRTLNNWRKQAIATGSLVAKKSPGRPLKIQGRDERRLIRVAKQNPKLTIAQIAAEAEIDACHRTIVSALKRRNLQSYPMLKKPLLTERHIAIRYQWAYSMRFKTLEDWKRWSFSDECSISLDCSEGVRRVVIERKDRHSTANCIGRKQNGGGKLMICTFIFFGTDGVPWFFFAEVLTSPFTRIF